MTADQLAAIRRRIDAVHATTVRDRAAARIDQIAHADDDIETLLDALDRLSERIADIAADMRSCANRRRAAIETPPGVIGDYPLVDASRRAVAAVDWWAAALDDSVKTLTGQG